MLRPALRVVSRHSKQPSLRDSSQAAYRVAATMSSRSPSWKRDTIGSMRGAATLTSSHSPTPASIANQRLSSISRHLSSSPSYEINTPFSTERQSVKEEDFDAPLPNQQQQQDKKPSMSSSQAPHPAVMIPGPIEYDDEVLKSMSHFRSVLPVSYCLTSNTC